MPGKNSLFTPSSILFRPHHQLARRSEILDYQGTWLSPSELVVEAPGTAPGSEWLITTVVYHHSRTSRQR